MDDLAQLLKTENKKILMTFFPILTRKQKWALRKVYLLGLISPVAALAALSRFRA